MVVTELELDGLDVLKSCDFTSLSLGLLLVDDSKKPLAKPELKKELEVSCFLLG